MIIANSENSSKMKTEKKEKLNNFLCQDSCNSCQQSLFLLKHHKELDCKLSQCPDLCFTISSRFISGLNPHINFFVNNNKGTCNTCLKLGLCKSNQCEYQKKFIHTTINSVLENKHEFHIIQTHNNIDIKQINQRSSEYTSNMNSILSNMDDMTNILENYILLWNKSKQIKNIYIKIFSIVMKRNLFDDNYDSIYSSDNANDFQNIIFQMNLKFKGLINNFYRKIEKNKLQLLLNEPYDSQSIYHKETIIIDYINLNQDIYAAISEMLVISEKIKHEIIKNSKLVQMIKEDLIKDSNLNALLSKSGLLDRSNFSHLKLKNQNNGPYRSIRGSKKINKLYVKSMQLRDVAFDDDSVNPIDLTDLRDNDLSDEEKVKDHIGNKLIIDKKNDKFATVKSKNRILPSLLNKNKTKLKNLLNRIGNKSDSIKETLSKNYLKLKLKLCLLITQ